MSVTAAPDAALVKARDGSPGGEVAAADETAAARGRADLVLAAMRDSRASLVVLASIAILQVAFFTVARSSPFAQGLLYQVTSAVCVAAVGLGLRRHMRGAVRTWVTLAAGITCFATGDLLWALRNAYAVDAVPNAASDIAYLAAYIPLIWSLFRLTASRREGRDDLTRELHDATIIFFSAFTLLWFLTLDSIVHAPGQSTGQTVLDLLYPAFDLVLLSLLVRFALAAAAWPPAYRLLALGFGFTFLGDILWRAMPASAAAAVASWTNFAFMTAYGFWAAAMLHPSAASLGRPADFDRELSLTLSRRRLAVLGAAVLVPAIVLLTRRGKFDDGFDLVVFSVALAVIPLMTLERVRVIVRALHRALNDLEDLVAACPVPICVVDGNAIVRTWNAAAEEVSGYRSQEVIGLPPPLRAAGDDERVADLYGAALAGARFKGVEVKLLDRFDRPLDTRFSTAPLSGGGLIALFEDVSEERRHAEEMTFLAQHDSLTGLLNRATFRTEFEASLVEPLSRGTVVVLDLDNLKLVNDAGGHAAGDQLLVELPELLRAQLRPTDVFGRLGGDEFGIYLREIDVTHASAIVERLLQAARNYRLRTGDGTFDITLSAGLYEVGPADSAAVALRRADEALYDAKARGKNNARVWEANGHEQPGWTRRWSPIIKDAISEGRIEIFLQPVVELPSGRAAFHEALCRLRTPAGEYVQPRQFLEPAAQLGLMPTLDRHIVGLAATALREHPELTIFVNLSPSSFDDEALLRLLESTLKELPPHRLGFEITEEASFRDFDAAALKLARLRELGARIAIDDFGLGYTSFVHVAALPSDLIKIDAELVRAGSDTSADAIVAAITTVAHAHGKKVVLEGVETKADAERALAHGIEFAQGWLFGAPEPLTPVDLPATASVHA